VLGDGLREQGAEVHQIAFYDTVLEQLSEDQQAAVTEADFVTFASGSAVHSLVQALGGSDPLQNSTIISIGPTTSAALREHGLEPTTEGEQHDIDGLLAALLKLA
jgi:uroporphyrinogen-III synthase